MNDFDNDFSAYQKALGEVYQTIMESYDEEYNAQEVSDEIDEAQVTYNKIQKILNTPEMIKSHAYLYALDMENVDECDKQKIDKLYELGKARGVIQEDEPEQTDDNQKVQECDSGDICGGPDDALTNQDLANPNGMKPARTSSAYTILYSAMKDGQIKTGTFFSSAVDDQSAKDDCIQNLSPLGYSNIRILGIEKTDTAVDTGNSDLGDTSFNIDEDDSKEFENQETGADDGQENSDGAKDDAKTDDAGTEDKETKTGSSDGSSAEQKTDGQENKNDGQDAKTGNPGDENKDDAEGKDGEEAEKKKLTPTEKQVLRDEYVGMFKSELQKTGLEKSVDDMTIKERAAFWKTISEKWTKEEPEEFMSDKEIEKLYSTVIKN